MFESRRRNSQKILSNTPWVVRHRFSHPRCKLSEIETGSPRWCVVQQSFVAVVAEQTKFIQRMQPSQVPVLVICNFRVDAVERGLHHPLLACTRHRAIQT